ncbi:DUF2169 domain-containing protein [Sorangium sp. So ce204]|uniref:DUF2169 family type VI secretion system accessory protein n=1 Tax=Sorangium sp. So ce204 TaxID=3133288 RepID=UPI003F5D875F
MDVVSDAPLRVASILWQPQPGAFALTVVCKATFSLRPVASPLALEQDETQEADAFWGDDARRSLRAASDLAPFKRRADVLLVGHARAPSGKPARSLVVGLHVGEVRKVVEVHADRAWTADGQLRTGAPFVQMPLRWERAAGGPGTPNPVGVAADTPRDGRGLRALPNLQPAGVVIASPKDSIAPVGFGPIAAEWPWRVGKLYRHAAAWDHRAWNLRPLPPDIDAAYFNAAPPDQQVEQLRGDERIVLVHLRADHARLETQLERVLPRAVVQRSTGAAGEIRLRCDTLCIDADRGTCALTWRGVVPLQHPAERGWVRISLEGAKAPRLQGAAPPQTADTRALPATTHQLADEEDADTRTLPVTARVLSDGEGAVREAPAGLPFVPGASALWPFPDAERAAKSFAAATPEPTDEDEGTGTITGPVVRGNSALLPFLPAPRPLDIASGGTGLEGARDEAAGPRAAPTPEQQDEDEADAGISTVLLPQLSAAALQAFLAPFPLQAPSASAPEIAEPVDDPRVERGADPRVERDADLRVGLDAPRRRPTPPPPPLLGMPLLQQPARDEPQVAQPAPAPDLAAAAAAAEDTAPALAPPPSPSPGGRSQPGPPQPSVNPAEIPVERFASLTAEIAEGRAPRAEVLRTHDLSEHAWTAVERHWRAALDQDLARGGGRLSGAYDLAYVAAVERFRGPIAAPEYVRLAVAQERGQAGEALDALRIQRPALMPILRLWTKKVARDGKLVREVTAMLAALRAE